MLTIFLYKRKKYHCQDRCEKYQPFHPNSAPSSHRSFTAGWAMGSLYIAMQPWGLSQNKMISIQLGWRPGSLNHRAPLLATPVHQWFPYPIVCFPPGRLGIC